MAFDRNSDGVGPEPQSVAALNRDFRLYIDTVFDTRGV